MTENVRKEPASRRDWTAKQRTESLPFMVIWEMTLACNLKCGHCGSRAGKRRPNELTTEESLRMIEHVAALGAKEFCIIGGEAHLRRDWLQIIRHIRANGMYCGMQTGGYNLRFEKLRQAREAGLNHIGLSIDGLEELHDRVRGVKGSFEHAIRTIRYAHELGLKPVVNTQVGAGTAADLPGLVDVLIAEKVHAWRCQITAPMGNAADNEHLLLQPYELKEVLPLIASLYQKCRAHGMLADAGNNLGFFGPSEPILRPDFQWTGCSAGQNLIAIEADGTVKSCPSLATASFAAGNVREMSLEDIWRYSDLMHWARVRQVEDLWGYCRTCYYNEVCYAGCTWMGHSLFGKAGNNPWCEYRVNELAKQGLRERVVRVGEASKDPFGTAEFALITEPVSGEGPATVQRAPRFATAGPLVQLQIGTTAANGKTLPVVDRSKTPPPGKLVKRVKRCPACSKSMYMREENCPECGYQMPEWRPSRMAAPPVAPSEAMSAPAH